MSETARQTERGEVLSEAELRRALVENETRLTKIAGLAAHMRHEINNSLTGLLGQTQLLLCEDLSEAVRRRVLIIEELAACIRDTAAELRAVERPRSDTARDEEAGKDSLPLR